jgi:hypothetical protein
MSSKFAIQTQSLEATYLNSAVALAPLGLTIKPRPFHYATGRFGSWRIKTSSVA